MDMVNFILLAVFICSLAGILFIIGRKFPILANIDLSQVPEEKMARVKKELLKKRINRQMAQLGNRLKAKMLAFKRWFKEILIGFQFRKILDKIRKNFARLKTIFLKVCFKILDFFRKIGKVVK